VSKRSRRTPIIAIPLVLMVGGLALSGFVRKAQERQEFVGPVDPATGYRCRFTLATEWKRDGNTFTAPLPIYQRINRFLFHRPTDDPPTIWLDRFSVKEHSGRFSLVDEYPELHTDLPARVIVQSRVQIDGYPATRGEWGIGPVKPTNRTAFLLVYVPKASTVYQLMGWSQGSHQAADEMAALIDSFHIEKAVVPSNGKQ
jgi:hypothetical protein